MPSRRRISDVAGRRDRGLAVWCAAGILLAIVTGALFQPTPLAAQTIETSASHAYVIDYETGTVLLSKEPDIAVPPASMAKLMTLDVVFEAIEEGDLSLDDQFFISEHAWRTGGAPSRTATMFADINSHVALSNLLRGIMVQTGNDACIAIAEGMAGSEDAFAVIMNERAQELGMTHSVFTNPTGFPDPEQKASVRDLVILARHVIEEHDRLYRIFSEPEFTWNDIRQLNKNPLIASGFGADGLVAGYDEKTGFGMIASAKDGDRRIILAVHGLSSDKERLSEVRKLLTWGFRSFERVQLFAAGEPVGEIGVYGGDQGRVALASREPIEILLPKSGTTALRGRIVYTGPVAAPVAEGAAIGSLKIYAEETLLAETPLFAVQSVGVGALHKRALDAALELVIGLVHSGVEAATSR